MNSSAPLIGIDAKRIVRNGTGLGSYGRTLVNDLAQYPLRLNLYAPDKGCDDLRSQIIARENITFVYPTSRHFKSYWRSRGIIADLKRDGIQLYHGLSGELPIGIRRSGIKSVVTIHDLIFLRHPEFYHPIDVQIYKWKFRQTLREADHIIAISECTKRDILEYGSDLVSEDRISLIYQSCSPRFEASPIGSSEDNQRYILSVGSIEARKNVLQAVQALPYLPDEISLVIVGRHTPYTDRISTWAEQHGVAHRVRILHGVSDAELPALYAGAEAFVYPSVYEGFGIPIIEAVRCGLPVVACTGSCLEEAGGPHNLYVAPGDVLGMADALRRSLKGAEDREQRIQLSQQYIHRFDGNDVAGQVVQLYERLLRASI
ncbi:glycosyltransferase family 1 protein [Prevotella sp. P6B1]|uniref:glycosyltransferase family 4 protein n=1 Tax=Prevotella sp. P6B1 TaxID=1410613 RepID=UPI00051AD26A|nr:glycosyltransferase family 1 protein [Prevotella sp. P6B1]